MPTLLLYNVYIHKNLPVMEFVCFIIYLLIRHTIRSVEKRWDSSWIKYVKGSIRHGFIKLIINSVNVKFDLITIRFESSLKKCYKY